MPHIKTTKYSMPHRGQRLAPQLRPTNNFPAVGDTCDNTETLDQLRHANAPHPLQQPLVSDITLVLIRVTRV